MFNDPYDCCFSLLMEKIFTDSELHRMTKRAEELASASLRLREDLLLKGMGLVEQGLASAELMKSSILNTFRKHEGEKIAKDLEMLLGPRGVFCLSYIDDSLLMWAHYADGHRGFCIGYSPDCFGELVPQPVTYPREPDPLGFGRMHSLDGMDLSVLHKMITTKGEEWEYEKEWRVINSAPETEVPLLPGSVKSVIFGSKMTEQNRAMLRCLVEKKYSDVTFGEAVPVTGRFKMVIRDIH